MVYIIGANDDTEDKAAKNKRSGKDCLDFETFQDGTLAGDPKYCFLSFACKQVDMKSDYVMFTGLAPEIAGGPLKMFKDHFDYMCTGCYAKKEDLGLDEEIS